MYFRRDITEELNELRLWVGRTMDQTIPDIQDQTAEEILDLAQQLCPVDTGSLQESGRIEEGDLEELADELGYRPRRRVAVIFGNEDGYKGGGSYGGKQEGAPVDYAPYVEFGTAVSPAQPFLTPAAEQIYPLYVERVKTALETK